MLINTYPVLREIGVTDKGPCTAVAWANVFDCSPLVARQFLYKFGYRRCGGGMTTPQVVAALKAVKKSTVVQGEYSRGNSITLKKFLQKHDKGRYYLLVRGHALAVIDGVIYDHKEGLQRQVVGAWRVYLNREGGYKEKLCI